MGAWFESQFAVSVITAAVVLGVMQLAVAYCIYFERKIAGWIQDRYGPNRVGPRGLLQPIADGLKFILKEDVIPQHVDKVLFVAAPAIIFLVASIGFAVIPWGGRLEWNGRLYDIQVAKLDIGVLYVLGVASLGVYGVVIGGWASNNKYSFYGGIRATAQMLSYEIPLGVCVLIVVTMTGTLRLEEIVLPQTEYWHGVIPKWNVFFHPLAFVILFVCALAEANRAPFDLAEAEQELVGGYHTEYSALKFGMFFLAEYAHMITSSALIAVLFFGGYHFPWWSLTDPAATSLAAVLAKAAVLSAKVAFSIFLMMWIRWTLPRFRFDQLMRLAWKGLIPVTLALFVLAVGLLYFGHQRSWVWAFGGNVVVVAAMLAYAGLRRVPVTGRQSDLPPVAGTAAAGIGG
ncbi:MAG: NADH-quinone oxidoreductase subunit NuoH [Planctomycetota bacterium]|nr:MAG: NADH-quinone oxidoreductase subunit NuoH [Planctomycetota bacterium]